MARLFALLLALLLLGAMTATAASAATGPINTMCGHAMSDGCDCLQAAGRCPDKALAGAACQSCCPAILPMPPAVHAWPVATILAPDVVTAGRVGRALTPEPPPPRTA
ncbi:hypothetical protein ACVWZA_003490 [Sphingomonas sp. UYAg733]